jgi:hypothetical protein
MLVGHNPAMHSLAHQLLDDPNLVKKFPPGAFLEIQWTHDATVWYKIKMEKELETYLFLRSLQRSHPYFWGRYAFIGNKIIPKRFFETLSK